ncbi:hypothetical protein PFLmoz3_02835 [Pseudomonas fluorescens]|uniref:Uncharacterized protein n=1 Tax=Pseudomonas fluorescens TaxID=294 RepID=A0A125QIF9_PSEFL|nr:hypothetical protein PFLmoz3_02835 [Pseudomonas fluorescens]
MRNVSGVSGSTNSGATLASMICTVASTASGRTRPLRTRCAFKSPLTSARVRPALAGEYRS